MGEMSPASMSVILTPMGVVMDWRVSRVAGMIDFIGAAKVVLTKPSKNKARKLSE